MYKVGDEMISIGIDVSKKKLDILWLRDILTGKVKTKVLTNDASGHAQLIEWVLKNTKSELKNIRFTMEATGIYHEALADHLFSTGTTVFVVNPARIKGHSQSLASPSKTDKKDSFIIAHFGATMALKPWEPESIEIQKLKQLIGRYQAIEKDLQREHNRQEKTLFSAKTTPDVSDSILTVIKVLESEEKQLKKKIDRHIDDHPDLKKNRKLLRSIPGVGEVVSSLMVAVIGSRPFEKASQCSAFLGLNPRQHESGSSVRKPTRLSKKGDARIRAKLYMAAVVAIQHNPDIKAQYKRLLKNGKSKMSALGAAMRKLVQICFGVLKHQTEYRPQIP